MRVHARASLCGGGIGWSGSWTASFRLSADSTRVVVKAGLALFNASIDPGQRFRAARVLACTYSGDDIHDGFNAHKHALAKHYLRKDSQTGLVRGGMVSSWTAQTYHADVNEANMLAMVAGVHAAGVESVWIDFGVRQKPGEPCNTAPVWHLLCLSVLSVSSAVPAVSLLR